MLKKEVAAIKPSPTLVINETCRQMQDEGKKIYKLGLGQSPFPIPAKVVDKLKEYSTINSYLPTKGLPALKASVKDFYQRHYNLSTEEDLVMIGPGSKELLFLFQMSVNWTVLLPTPCWVTYGPQARLFNNEVIKIHTSHNNKWKLTAEQLEEACNNSNNSTSRMLLLNSSNNPTGQTYSTKELKDIAAIATKHDIVILSDEIYSLLNFEGNCQSIASFHDKTVIASGLSKWCAAGGWRLGTFVFHKSLKYIQDAMVAIASESFSSVCSPVQYAAVTAFSEDFSDYLAGSRKILKSLGNYCAVHLQDSGVTTSIPNSGFYLFIDFDKHKEKLNEKGIITSEDLCNTILNEVGIALIPGAACERDPKELSARLAFVNFDGEKALLGLGSLDKEVDTAFLEVYCVETLAAIDALVNWLEKD